VLEQEIFDKVWDHFVVQKNLCGFSTLKYTGPVCRYRDQNGLCCAIGLFIPEDQYQPSFEGRTVDTLLGLPALRELRVSPNFLLMLQRANDRSLDVTRDTDGTTTPYWSPQRMKTNLIQLAHAWGLKVPRRGR